jgi:pyruvate/2-oxoglutarate dehydrogenase complex dihydrolipoamide acyltransferase (E2) component
MIRNGELLVILQEPQALVEVCSHVNGVVHCVNLAVGAMVAEGNALLSVDTSADTAPLPIVPPPDQTTSHADPEYIDPEIARIMEESARQAIFEVELEMKASGESWDRSQIFARQQLRTIELFMPASNAYIAHIREDGWREDVLDSLDANRAVLERIDSKPATKTSLDQLADFWRRHPFLVGFFGAELAHKLKRR